MNYKTKLIPILAVMLLFGFIVGDTGDLYAQSDKIICPQCGKENDAGAKFCWNDGFNLANVQKQQETIKPATPVTPIPPPKSIPVPVKQPDQPFEGMNNAEMRLLLTNLTARLEAANDRKVRDPNYIGNLTQTQFRILLENTLRDQNIVRTKVVKRKESGFGQFLKSVGAITLIIFGIGILASS